VKINNETLGNPTLRGGARPEAPLRLPAAGIQAVNFSIFDFSFNYNTFQPSSSIWT
jgi:hypothetical protein